jgi:hypothetical protein
MFSKQKMIVLATVLLVFLTLIACQVRRANAEAPSVLSIDFWMNETRTILNITIRHSGPPGLGALHHVIDVEVDINGTVINLDQTTPQSAETFVVQYDMGEMSEVVDVRARAYCTIHQWGSWSDPVAVSEYSYLSMVLVLTFCFFLSLFVKFRHSRHSRMKPVVVGLLQKS